MPPAARRLRQLVDDEEEDQRPRQRQRVAEPDDEEGQDDLEEEEEEQHHPAGESADSQLIKRLVRYALACDFSRTPIRRDGIKEKVLGDQGRAFRRVFDGAQKTLRTVFGMELVELPAKEKLTKEEKRKAAKSHTRSTQANAYVLVSLLPEPYRASKIIAPSKMISADDEAAYVAFYTMIISLIRINGGELSDPMLKRYLRRLNAETNTFNSTKTEDTLAKMQRQGYLIKTIDKEAKQHGEAEATTWHIGPRGKVEVNDETVAGMVREVWGPGQEAELEAKLKNSLNIRARDEVEIDGANEAEDANGDESRMSAVNGAAENGASGRRRSGRRMQAEEEEEE